MVAVLVLLMDQYWWCHTSSCFKQSKSTTSANLCRYSFPRERVKCTHFDSSGIETKLDLGHEFINGFNYTSMATFKCNHDIQVLLGGRDATDRIYYCLKSFRLRCSYRSGSIKKRQEREIQEEMQMTVNDDEHVARSRKRVASTVCVLTNR
ncbi:Hypothetical protein PHPALM_11797 [Phytophthora palmivora]|uniref:Uncharacterized protein n=1 Tax=Phytophthora palmivora TaxID=4796 RepID=A0A2P4Y1D6_9STRA|nr:Hypothetical protein PHPALM_11797 [Phytophthora palmivora]